MPVKNQLVQTPAHTTITIAITIIDIRRRLYPQTNKIDQM